MPLYMCQPPTGYKDTADAWVNTGALVNRMNFALRLGAERSKTSRRSPSAGLSSKNASTCEPQEREPKEREPFRRAITDM